MVAGIVSSRRVLLVGGEGVVLYGPTGKGVDRETSISWEVPNFDQQLADIFKGKNQSKSVIVLFDGADQTYRKEENIPKLSIVDRPRFVKRKLELAFPSYPIRASLEVRPPKQKGRKTSTDARSYLFVALPETDQLDRVGAAMFESGVPVSGFGLLPVESVGLVNELSDKIFGGAGKKSRWAVLVGQHETGGLRQVVIKDGNLALTRLTPTSEAGVSGAGWTEEVTREFRATLTYISRFGYNNDDGLDVVIVCGDAEKQFFDQKAIPVTNFRCVNPSEALRLIGCKSFGQERSNFADSLHAAWTGRKGGLKLSVRVPSISRIKGPRLAARIGSVILSLGIMGLLGVSGQDFQQYRSVEEDISQKQIQKSGLDREYEQESKVFDSLPVKPPVVKATLAVKKLAETNTMSVRPILHLLKNTLPGDLRVESFSVTHTASGAFPVENAAPAPTGRGAFVDPNDHGKVLITFSFTLPNGLTGDQKTARTDSLVKALQDAFKGYDVQVKQKFETSAEQNGSTGTLGSVTSTIPTPVAAKSSGDNTATIELKGAPLP
jgi:hypothetical protein